MNITSPAGNTYEVLKLIGKTDPFNLYECRLTDGRECILKIATTAAANDLLDREAFLLQTMREDAARLEAEYAEVKKGEMLLNYQFCFPGLVETFIDPDQGDRRINILSFFEISKKLSDLVPISHLMSRDHVRVDPKTSAWMLGKLLKLLVFTHSLGIRIPNLDGENIIINRDEHFVAVADWTQAAQGEAPLSSAFAMREIEQVAEQVILALGGNLETGEIPPDKQLGDGRYEELLFRLSRGAYADAKTAHGEFYELVGTLWPRGFHPFTAYAVK